MADDAALRRFLADAAPLRAVGTFEPSLAFRLLSEPEFDGEDELSPPIAEALHVSAVAMAVPTARNAAIALYALERAAIAVEGRLLAVAPVETMSFYRGLR